MIYLVSAKWDKFIWVLLIALMSFYIVYEHASNCVAVDLPTQIDRHRRVIEGRSEFFNPWQYRVFSPFLMEGVIKAAKAIKADISETVPFLAVKFFLHMLIFFILLRYLQSLDINNIYVLLAGLLISCYMIANSVFQSDLSLNTYFDVFFYVLAGYLVLVGREIWIIPVVFFAALNRETSGFIPFMLLAPYLGANWRQINKNTLVVFIISMALFVMVFLGVRIYYGWQQSIGIHGMRSPMDFLLFNLKFFRLYPFLFGTLGFLPLIVIMKLRLLPVVVQRWFWLIVPFWVIIHFVKSTAMETRLFLVPQLLIFVPGFLFLLQRSFDKKAMANPAAIEQNPR